MCEPKLATGESTGEMEPAPLLVEGHHTEYIKHMRRKSSSSSSSTDSNSSVEDTAVMDNDHQNAEIIISANHKQPVHSWWKTLLRRKDSIVSTSSSGPNSEAGIETPSPKKYKRPLLRKTEVHLKKSDGKHTETILLSDDDNTAKKHLVEMVSVSIQQLTSNETQLSPSQPSLPVREQRETWDKKVDFLLSIIGFAVDLANVWRFPFLCYRNGGGAFLIPYFLMLAFGAVPIFYMELILGQFHRQGPISVWNICPLFKGTGYCAVLVAYFVSFYYNVIIGWSFYFMFASLTFELPWLHCNNTWNTPKCIQTMQVIEEGRNLTVGINSEVRNIIVNMDSEVRNVSSAAKEYFERGVLELHKSSGVDDLGEPKWQLCLCVLLVYIVLYLSIFKGVKSSGKVVWVTATMPYVILSILLARGLLLEGATDGIIYFLRPDVSKLTETKVWVDAATQVFYSVGAGFGVHLTFASYNDFHSDCYKGCILTVFINSFTSLFSGLVIFTYLGYMAQAQNVDISSVATHGPGLVFEVYPEAIATLPGSNFWAFIFFFMLITLGMDSIMGGLESVITGCKDEFHSLFAKSHYSREIFTGVIMVVSYLVAITNLTRGGGYMLQWFDAYAAGVSLLCSALFETIGIAWFYGLDRFSEDIEQMLGSKPAIFWRICWKFVSPTFLVCVIVFAVLSQEPLTYGDYVYPAWIDRIGWLFALSAFSAIPITAIIVVIYQKGKSFKEKFAYSITPPDEIQKMAGTGQVKRFHLKHWLQC